MTRLPSLPTILKRNNIHPKFHAQFQALVDEGRRPSKELLTRLNAVGSYRQALDEIMTELSRGLDFVFPPTNYETPAHYKSLSTEEAA